MFCSFLTSSRGATLLLATVAVIGCSSATRPLVQPQGATAILPAEQARLEIEHPRSAAAGVTFMSGMIAHHAQAITIADWAASHGASPAVRTLCERIAVSQADEIRFMQQWLSDRHQPVPAMGGPNVAMPGMDTTGMPGMLSADQIRGLDSATGAQFDRLLLTDMIMHHRGALDMVHRLMASGPVDDDALAMYATNVDADQSAEIGRMERMLAALPDSSSTPSSHR